MTKAPSTVLPRTRVFFLAAWVLLLCLDPSALADAPLPPLRIPSQPVGSRCFGLLPCTAIDPFGIRLRAAVLAIFRPEKGHDRDLYAARIQLAPSVTLFEWGEIGVAIPITLYKKDIGVIPIYEPLQPFARVRLPLDTFLRGLATTAFVRIHIAHGPFVGGLPPASAEKASTPATPDFVAQAIQSYQAQTQFEFGLAMQKRIGPVTATGSMGASVATQRVEVYGGAELAYHFKIFNAFVQGQGIGVPKCPPEEAALNFCARGFRFGAGVRFDFDIGQGGLMIGTGSGAVEPGWMVGAQLGLDYDETVRHMHGDGVEAAHAWWDRRFEAMARGWAEWKSAASVWPEDEVSQHIGPRRPGPFSDLLGGTTLPESPWMDALLDDPPPYSSVAPEPTTAVPVAPTAPGSPSAKAPPKRQIGQKAAHPYAGVRQAAARGQRTQIPAVPGFQLPAADQDWMKSAELDRLWRATQQQQRNAEQQQWRDASALPPMEKVILNTLLTAPYEASLFFLEMSGPGAAAEVEAMRQRLRPLKYTPAEQDSGAAMEGAFRAMIAALGPASAEQAMARLAMLDLARQEAQQAGRAAAFAAAERPLLGAALEEGAAATEQSGPRFASILDRLPPRLNPMNYRVCGVGCGGADIEFSPPKLPTAASSTEGAGVGEGEAVHVDAAYKPPQVLGRGSTANPAKDSTLPRNLKEQLAVEQAMSDPTAGIELTKVPMGDPRWERAEGWVKMQQEIRSSSGERIVVHYVRNKNTGAIDDFKIKLTPQQGN